MTKRNDTLGRQRMMESGSPRFALVLFIINPKNQFLSTPYYINGGTRERKKVDPEAQNAKLLKINSLINQLNY